MGDRANINASYGGRQSGADGEAIMASFGGGGVVTPTPTPTPSPPTGFAMNGATNATLKAMLARVAGGTGRGRVVFAGDSAFVGVGANVTADGTTSSVAAQCAGARPYGPSAVLAAELTALGYPALDNARVADGSLVNASVALTDFDPRVALGSPAWTVLTNQLLFAGGSLIQPNTGAFAFTATTAVDSFEAVFYRDNGGGVFTVTVDDAAVAVTASNGGAVSGAGSNVVTVPASGNGFCKVTGAVGSAATRTLKITGANTNGFLCYVRAWNSAVPAIDLINNAGQGLTSAQQAAAGSGYKALDALGFDAPDLTIVKLGLNDAAQGVSAASYVANLRAIITKARLTGDVLLVTPHFANPSFAATANQTALRDAAAALAAASGTAADGGAALGCAYFDEQAYFGAWSTIAARTADGLVHPNRGMYAEEAQALRRCIQVMSA
ncbi:MAG: SGNH/GDSL hydrolase family protein [Polynucleobacter sp.]